MTPQRFLDLLDAYGADLRHWPAQEQAAAQSLMQQPANAEALRQARALDALLGDAGPVPAPAALAERIIAAAPRPAATSGWWPRWSWWSGLGLAGAGMAGILAGSMAVTLLGTALLDDDGQDHGGVITAFSDVSQEWR